MPNCGGNLDSKGTTCIYCGATYKNQNSRTNTKSYKEALEEFPKTFNETKEHFGKAMQTMRDFQKMSIKSIPIGLKIFITIFIIFAILFFILSMFLTFSNF